MLGNLIIVLIVLAVAVGFALLARRAWRSKRGLVKWGGLLLSGLLTLVVGFIGVLAIVGMTKLYIPTSEPIPNITYRRHAGADRARRVSGEHRLRGLSRRRGQVSADRRLRSRHRFSDPIRFTRQRQSHAGGRAEGSH